MVSPTARPFPGPGWFTHPLKGDPWQKAIFRCLPRKKRQEAAGGIPRWFAVDCCLWEGWSQCLPPPPPPHPKTKPGGSVSSHLRSLAPCAHICIQSIGFPSLANTLDFLCACVTQVLCVWKPEVNIDCLPRLFTILFLRQGLSLILEFDPYS